MKMSSVSQAFSLFAISPYELHFSTIYFQTKLKINCFSNAGVMHAHFTQFKLFMAKEIK